MKTKKAFRPVLVALSVMLLGLFMLCAHNQTIETPGEDRAGRKDEFRQELLDMLDLSKGDSEVQEFAAGDASLESPEESGMVESSASSASAESSGDLSADDQAELMALLAGIEEEEDNGKSQPAQPAAEEEIFEMADASTSTAPVVATQSSKKATGQPNYYLENLRSEVERLETILEKRSEQVDSLRRIIDNRNARLAELQRRKTGGSLFSEPTPVLAESPGSTPKPVATVSTVGTAVAEKYNMGRSQFESFNYEGCIQTMSELLKSNPSSLLADNAQYWIGESYYGLKQYQKAILELQKVFSFNATDKYDDAQLMIGLCYVRLGQQEMARSTFGDFLETFAGSEYHNIARRYYENI